jgi:PAS domain S-box-containing protein
MMILDLVHNLALLMALAAASQVIAARWQVRRLTSQILHGLLFGAVGVVGMMTPVHFQPGIIFDGRSIILSVAGLLGGPIVALLAALMCGAYRLWLGGVGTAMGVSVVLASAALGVAFYYGRRRVARPLGWGQLWGFGLLVSGVMVALVMLLPAGTWHAAWQQLGLPIIGFYPVATMLISLLFLDYEKQRRDRTAIEESEARYRTMLEQAADGVFMHDESGRILEVNRKACLSLGYTREELLAKAVGGIDPTARQSETRELWGRVLAGESFTFEGQHRRKDGSTFPVEVTLGSVRLSLGPAVLAIVRNITDRKRAEESLKESRRMLLSVLDTIPVRVFWKDTEGRFLGSNQSFACDAGFDSPETLIGKDDYDMAWKNQADLYRADDRQVITRGVPKLQYEEAQTTPAGMQLWLRTSKIPLRDLEGRTIGILGTYEDITEKKQLEAQFLRAQRMDGLGSLAGGIAHDLNNILTPILVAAPLLRAAASDAESRKMLDTVHACAQRGADIIRQLLTFARGQPEVRVPLPVRHILHEIEKIVSETFPRNLRLEIAAPYDRWLVQGDATQIQQALMNLCVNARDAMPGGGTLTLTAENVALDAAAAALVSDAKPDAKPGDYVCISVTDTGTGIPREQLDRVFDPFFTTKEIGRGTGLGLSTVLGIVRGHGGFVRVDSRSGKGTKFELYLPASREAKEARTAAPETLPPRGHGELILVVEDEAAVLGVVQCVLEQQGYRVLAATEGAEALALLAQHHSEVKAVLTDMMMPGVDGPTLVHALRHNDPRLPILGMSGLGEQAGAKGLEGLDPPELLAKPFTVEALLTAVHRTLTPRTPEAGS